MKQKNQEASAAQNAINHLEFAIDYLKPTFCSVVITVPKLFVNTLFAHASADQKQLMQTIGFNRGEVPIEYIEQNFMHALIEHLQEYIFTYFILPFLYQEIRKHRLLMSGEPRLKDIKLRYNEDAQFTFHLSLFPEISLQDWRYFPFKAPKRKKYKDLDRQVDAFVKQEREALKKYEELEIIHMNDWVLFSLTALDNEHKPLFDHEPVLFWLKMGDEEADSTLRNLFVGKRKGEEFHCQEPGLQQIFSKRFDTHYPFLVNIFIILFGF